MYILYKSDINFKANAYDIAVSKNGTTLTHFEVPNWTLLVQNCNGKQLVYLYFNENGTTSVTTGYYSRYTLTPEYKKILYSGSYIGSDITEQFNILTEFNTHLLVAEKFRMVKDNIEYECRIISQQPTYTRGVPSKMTLTCEIIY